LVNQGKYGNTLIIYKEYLFENILVKLWWACGNRAINTVEIETINLVELKAAIQLPTPKVGEIEYLGNIVDDQESGSFGNDSVVSGNIVMIINVSGELSTGRLVQLKENVLLFTASWSIIMEDCQVRIVGRKKIGCLNSVVLL
jgi:hypothetical protein